MTELTGWGEGGDWLEGHLFDRRVVSVRGRLDGASATRLASQLMTLDATGDDVVQLQLDCEGGSLEATFAVVDVIDALGVPVRVTCLGRVEGPPVLVAAVCSRRLAFEHTRFRLQDPELSFEAKASQLESLVAHHELFRRRYHERLAFATGREVEEIRSLCQAGRYLSAAEAVELGLVDEIVRPRRAQVRAFPGGS